MTCQKLTFPCGRTLSVLMSSGSVHQRRESVRTRKKRKRKRTEEEEASGRDRTKVAAASLWESLGPVDPRDVELASMDRAPSIADAPTGALARVLDHREQLKVDPEPTPPRSFPRGSREARDVWAALQGCNVYRAAPIAGQALARRIRELSVAARFAGNVLATADIASVASKLRQVAWYLEREADDLATWARKRHEFRDLLDG